MSSDGNLLIRAADGDAEAFEKIIVEYEKHIFNISYRMLGNVEDAKDASQESIIKIYRNIGRCKDIKALKGWITTITSNTCIDFLRRRKRFNTLSLEAEIETEDGVMEIQIASDEPSPEEQTLYRELRSDISHALSKLSDTSRILIVLRDIYGYSYNDISTITGIQLGTVKSGISRARNNLRNLIEKEEQKNIPIVLGSKGGV